MVFLSISELRNALHIQNLQYFLIEKFLFPDCLPLVWQLQHLFHYQTYMPLTLNARMARSMSWDKSGIIMETSLTFLIGFEQGNFYVRE